MATVTHPRHYMRRHYEYVPAKLGLWAVPIGRFLFGIIFVLSGLTHFTSGSIGYAANAGVPMPGILVPVSGVMAMVGGLSVITGLHARMGALLLILFLIPVTLMMHNFWAYTDQQMAQMQMIHFLKNISMLGCAILIAFYGAGPKSYDNHRAKRHT